MTPFITGSGGFIGTALCAAMAQAGHAVVKGVRDEEGHYAVPLGVDVAIHLAALVPLLGEAGTELQAHHLQAHFQKINTQGTEALARQCAQQGVRRFIFMSSIKVLGEGKDTPYREDDLAMPSDAYAISKWEAEARLRQIERETGMEVVIVRPPLVYGSGVKGNFLKLMQTIDQHRSLPLPLPLGAIKNKRSLMYVGNLVDFVMTCAVHPKAAGRTFLVSDGFDVSTPELVRYIARALGRPALLLPFPVSWMQALGAILGKQAAVQRLVGSYTVDTELTQQVLGWQAPYSLPDGIQATADGYQRSKITNQRISKGGA